MTFLTCYIAKNKLDVLKVDSAVQATWQNVFSYLRSGKELVYVFGLGGIMYFVFSAKPAWADDLGVTNSTKKELSRRLSNVVGCGAIISVCGKAAKTRTGEKAVEQAFVRPQVVAAFACGAAVAWCAKYAIFDK